MVEPSDEAIDVLLNQLDFAARHTDQYSSLPIWNNTSGRAQMRNIVRSWWIDLSPEASR